MITDQVTQILGLLLGCLTDLIDPVKDLPGAVDHLLLICLDVARRCDRRDRHYNTISTNNIKMCDMALELI